MQSLEWPLTSGASFSRAIRLAVQSTKDSKLGGRPNSAQMDIPELRIGLGSSNELLDQPLQALTERGAGSIGKPLATRRGAAHHK